MLTDKDYNAIVDQYSDRVYEFTLRCSSNKPLAKESTFELYEKLWQNRKKITLDFVKIWLFKHAFLFIKDDIRRGNLSYQHVGSRTNDTFDFDDVFEKFLPFTDKCILYLRDVENLDYQSIQKVINLSPLKIKESLFKSRFKILKLNDK